MKKITDLPENSTPAGNDLLPMVDVDNNETVKVTRQQFLNDAVDTIDIKDNAVTSPKIADDAVNSSKIDFGGSGAGLWWEEIARTTLTGNADTITATFAGRKYIRFHLTWIGTGSMQIWCRFNGDTGNNYGFRYTIDNTLGSGIDNTNQLGAFDGGQTHGFATGEILNQLNIPKFGSAVSTGGAVNANRPAYVNFYFKWYNITSQLTSINFYNINSGDFTAGTELIVLGHN